MPEETLYLYRIQPTRPEMLSQGPNPQEQAAVAEHFAYLRQLTSAGIVKLAGRTLNTDPSSFGIVLFTAPTETRARQIMQQDPAVAQGVMRADLFPFRIALLGQLPVP